jgi:hypothetical protein
MSSGPPGLWSIFSDRALELRTMGPQLRFLTLLAVGQIVAAMVLLALRDVYFRSTPLGSGTAVALVVLWATVAFMALAWSYLLAGAFSAQPFIGLVSLIAFGLALIPLDQDIGWHGAPAVLRGCALAAIVGIAVHAWWRRLRSGPDEATGGAVRLVLVGAAVAAVYLSFAWDAASNTMFRFFNFGVADQLMSVSYFLLPVLFLAGAEFADWAEVIGDRASYLAERIGSTRLLAALAGAISVAVMAHAVIAHGAQLPSEVAEFALAAAVVIWAARRSRPAEGWPCAVPWVATALATCVFIGALLIEIYRATPGTLHAGATTAAVTTPLSSIHHLVHRRLDPYRYDPVLVVPFLIWVSITATAGLWLVRLRDRLSPSVALGGVFVLAFGTLFVLSDTRQVVEELFDARVGALYSLRLPGIQAAVAVATLCWLAVALAREELERAPLTELVVLGGGLQVLAWLSSLYKTAALVGAQLSIVQAVVILLALSWELIVSGEPVTNGDSRAFPRVSRVLLFCGYIMLVATAVLLFSSLRAHGSGALLEPQFESEGWPALGIVQLGVPVLLCVAALRLGLFTPGAALTVERRS